jgi:hypothetical protein
LHPRNLLWTLFFLKTYPRSTLASVPFHCCNQTTFFQVVWGLLDFFDEILDEVINKHFFTITINKFKGFNIKCNRESCNYRHNWMSFVQAKRFFTSENSIQWLQEEVHF